MRDSAGVEVVSVTSTPAPSAAVSEGVSSGVQNPGESENRENCKTSGDVNGSGSSSGCSSGSSTATNNSSTVSEAESPAPSSEVVDGNLSDSQEESVASEQRCYKASTPEHYGCSMDDSQRDEIHSKIVTAFSSAFQKQNVHFEKGERYYYNVIQKENNVANGSISCANKNEKKILKKNVLK